VLQAIVIALAAALGLGWASLVVGAALVLAGGAALMLSRKEVSASALTLPRSQEQLRETVRAAREQAP
jgi:outer membrane murein-binding lipoprotein Lpp